MSPIKPESTTAQLPGLFAWDMGLDLRRLPHTLAGFDARRRLGRVLSSTGQTIESAGPSVHLGELVSIVVEDRPGVSHRRMLAEVVGFRDGRVLSMPLCDPQGLVPGALVAPTEPEVTVPVGAGMIGRIVDGLGNPIDDGPVLTGLPRRPARGCAPGPLDRRPVDQALATGIGALDTVLTCGRGQRIGIMAGSGVGKTTLLANLIRRTAADVCVVALIGERGREICEFVHGDLGPEGMSRSVLVAVDAAASPILRTKGVQTAMAIAESFRDVGADVLLVCDSLTRYAFALREMALALGEPASARGYPPSVFSQIPRLLERAGATRRGSITAFFTVLVEGDDLSEPVADAVRGMLDGHIVLDRKLAERGHYPPIDVLASVSRVFERVVSPGHRALARKAKRILSEGAELEDMVAIGAYTRGLDPDRDRILRQRASIMALLTQDDTGIPSIGRWVDRLESAIDRAASGSATKVAQLRSIESSRTVSEGESRRPHVLPVALNSTTGSATSAASTALKAAAASQAASASKALPAPRALPVPTAPKTLPVPAATKALPVPAPAQVAPAWQAEPMPLLRAVAS